MKGLGEWIKEKQIIVPNARIIGVAINVMDLLALPLGDAVERVLGVVQAETAENDDTVAMLPTAVLVSWSWF